MIGQLVLSLPVLSTNESFCGHRVGGPALNSLNSSWNINEFVGVGYQNLCLYYATRAVPPLMDDRGLLRDWVSRTRPKMYILVGNLSLIPFCIHNGYNKIYESCYIDKRMVIIKGLCILSSVCVSISFQDLSITTETHCNPFNLLKCTPTMDSF